MDLNICNLNKCNLNICILVILRYHIFILVLCIHISYFRGHNTLPLHGKTCSAIDEQTENGPKKTPPTTHLNVRWRKKDPNKCNLNICILVILRYHIFILVLCIHISYFLWAQHSSPPWQDLLCHG